MAVGFFFGIVALTFPQMAILRRRLDNHLAGGSLDAAPTMCHAICVRSFLRIVALTSSLLALRRSRFDDDLAVGSLHATPTWLAIGERVLLRNEPFTTPLLTIFQRTWED